MQPTTTQPDLIRMPRPLQFALFLTGLLWLFAARSAADHASTGIAVQFGFSSFMADALKELFFLFLLLIGFTGINFIATRSGSLRQTNALPIRPTAAREWQLGAVIGWAAILIALLPMMFAADLHPTFWLTPHAILLTFTTIFTVAMMSLALEVAFRGFLFRRLIGTVGPTLATILLSALYAFLSSLLPNATFFSVLITFLLGVLLSMAYLRTHALWLGWGLHFAWNAVMGIAFGLPVAGLNGFSTIVDTNISGSPLITGGPYGPEAAPFTLLCVVAAMIVLYRTTRDYAWEYTLPTIVGAGVPADVAPPEAHNATKYAAPPPLVSILATTPDGSSTMPEAAAHIRSLEKPPSE